MPDPTTPDDRFDAHAEEISGDSPWIEDSPAESTNDLLALTEADRVEVDAFRDNLESESVTSSAIGDAKDREEVSRQLQAHRHGLNLRPPGPGIPEAVAWMFGVFVVQFMGMLAGFVVIIVGQVMRLMTSGAKPSEELVQSVLRSVPQLLENHMLELMIVQLGIFFVAAVLATRIRLGARVTRLLAIRPLVTNHALLIMAVSIPAALMSGGLHQITLGIWNEYFAHLPIPGIDFLNNSNVNEAIKPIGEAAPFGLLILLVAVLPAISEELVFRGVIGRGLIARWGILPGVILTSIMFGLVHVHPAHVVALMPLAFLLHLTYLATRSILAPMLLHFLNNSLAVVLLKASLTVPALEEASEPAMPWYVLLISGGIVGLVAWTLWRSRVDYRTEDGQEWSPGYASVEMPPESTGAVLTAAKCPVGLRRGAIGLAGAYSLVFVVSLVLMLTGHISA